MKVAALVSVVLLCAVLVSIIYGVSVVVSTSLDARMSERLDRHEPCSQLADRMHYDPYGDPVEDPIPNQPKVK